MPGIIVGVDESVHSTNALRWAMQEAVLRQLPLTVVTVIHAQVRPATEIYWGAGPYARDDINEDHVRAAVQELTEKAASEIAGTIPEITVNVAVGNPAEELVNASRDAVMLVVGSRGSGGFGKLLLGSVSSQVTHHAVCPVLVIPSTRPAR